MCVRTFVRSFVRISFRFHEFDNVTFYSSRTNWTPLPHFFFVSIFLVHRVPGGEHVHEESGL